MMNKLLLTGGRFSCCGKWFPMVKGPSACHHALSGRVLGVPKLQWGNTARTADPSCPKGSHTTPCSAITAGVKKEEGETFTVLALIFPMKYCLWWSPAFVVMAKYLPTSQKQ